MKTQNTRKRYTNEFKTRAIRMVNEARPNYPSKWSTIQSIAQKLGCTPETLRKWYNQHQQSQQPEQIQSDQAKIKQLEQENKELKQINEILKKASAFFAQAELDRPPK